MPSTHCPSPWPAALDSVVERVVIHSPRAFSFAGEPATEVPAGPQPGSGPWQAGPGGHPLPAHPLVAGLQGTLYGRCYSRPLDDSPPPPALALASHGAEAAAFLQALSRANRSRERWDGGWSVHQVYPGGQLAVHKGERHRSAAAGEYVTAIPGRAPVNGDEVSLRVPRESAQLQPGFYFVFGETLSDVYDDAMTVRFYFHVARQGAELLVATVSKVLNEAQVPFRFKCLSHPDHYQRTDAAVLYVSRRHYQVVARRLLASLPEELARQLRPQVPLFSKPLRLGIGLAEDPGNGESFGMHRCRLVAEALVTAWQRGEHGLAGRRAVVAERFAAAGMSFERPHLNPGSAELPELPQNGGIAL